MDKTKNGKRLGKKIAGGIVRFGEGLREGYEEEKEKTKKEKVKKKPVITKKVVAKAKKTKKTKAIKKSATKKKSVTKKKPLTKTKNGKKLGKVVMGGIIEFGEGAREAYEKESGIKKKKPVKKKKKRVSTLEEDYFF